MSKIYFVHAATDVGVPVMKASRATIDEALRDAAFELSGGAAFVWIVDGDGHLILPADQIKARLDQANPRAVRFRQPIGSPRPRLSAPSAERPGERSGPLEAGFD